MCLEEKITHNNNGNKNEPFSAWFEAFIARLTPFIVCLLVAVGAQEVIITDDETGTTQPTLAQCTDETVVVPMFVVVNNIFLVDTCLLVRKIELSLGFSRKKSVNLSRI